MKRAITITFADGSTREVAAGPADFVAFEDKYGVSAINFEIPDPSTFRVQWIYFVAWHSQHRSEPDVAEFDKWLGQITDVEVVQVADPPTKEATPSDDESPELLSAPV